MESKLKTIPVRGSRPSKRKCKKKDICESYGHCSPNCPEYVKYTKQQVEHEEVEDEYLKHLDKKGKEVMQNKPLFIQTATPPHLISICLAYMDQEGYTYVDTILLNHMIPTLIFKRR